MHASISRRRFSQLALLTQAAATFGCARKHTTADVFAGLVQGIVVPDTANCLLVAQELRETVSQTSFDSDAPQPEFVEKLQRALVTYETAIAFKRGPLVDTSALFRATYFPPRREKLREMLAQVSPPSVQEVQELGVDLKGLYAIAWLSSAESKAVATPAIRKRWAQSLADAVHQAAVNASREAIAPAQLVEQWMQAAEKTISGACHDMLTAIETMIVSRLEPVVTLAKQKRLNVADVRGAEIGASTTVLRAYFAGIVRIYHGEHLALGTLVKERAPEIHARLIQEIDSATTALAAIAQPLEIAATTSPEKLQAAIDALRNLERSVKTDMMSALGVTLLFTATDGD